MTTRFILLASQRTGSTLVWRTLDLHPAIRARGELFLRHSEDPDSYAAATAGSTLASWRSRLTPARFASSYLTDSLRAARGLQATGFKLMYSQVPPGFWNWSAQQKPAFVHLQRKNLLKVLISKAAAEQSGVRHRSATEAHAFDAIELPVEGLVGKLERLRADIERHERLIEEHHVTTAYYEDLLADPERFFVRLFTFLDVEPIALAELPLQKLVSDSIDDAIANAAEIRAALAATPFASWAV